MAGVSFDRAAAFYDATRGLPDGVPEVVRDAIVRRVGAGPDTRFLEIGIGTGRIALPFLVAGHAYGGVDLSAAMLGKLRAKLAAGPALRARAALAQADATSLPVRTAAVDVALMIHVLHLVDDPRRALAEARRILRPGGRLIVSANDFAERNRRDAAAGRAATGGRLVTNRWNAILAELGLDGARRTRGRWILDEDLAGMLAALGASVERVVLAEYRSRPHTAREVAAAHRDRVFSSDWDVPDDVHAEAAHRLARWLDTEHPAPDEPVSDESAVVALIGTFPA